MSLSRREMISQLAGRRALRALAELLSDDAEARPDEGSKAASPDEAGRALAKKGRTNRLRLRRRGAARSRQADE